MKLQAMIGVKIFKELEDGTIELYRIMNVKKYKDSGNPSSISVRNEETGEMIKIRTDELKEYTPLESDGMITFNIVKMKDSEGKLTKDVVVTITKALNIKIGDPIPFAVCRQSITDVFYNLLISDENQMMTGLAVNQNDCPSNFDFRYMLACDGIDFSECINIYRTDTLNDIYYLINKKKYDAILEDLYMKHVDASKNPTALFKKSDRGWCKDLETLLKENNFQADIDEMFGITEVEFTVADYLKEAELPNREKYTTVVTSLKEWLSVTYKLAINDLTVLVYDHDIDLADFNQARYFLIRDSLDVLYLFVYTLSGEYYEKDLEEEANKKDFSTKFRLKFYNKYNVNK